VGVELEFSGVQSLQEVEVKRKKLSRDVSAGTGEFYQVSIHTPVDIEADAMKRRRERMVGNMPSVRPYKHIPIGWPSDGKKPPWA
jgi:hypothetical protein